MQHTPSGTDGCALIEQYNPVAERSAAMDVYGLAATLYTMLTAEIPVCAPARADSRALDPPQSLNPQIKPHIQAAIVQGMTLNAADPYPTS
jgi:hypothetical protein